MKKDNDYKATGLKGITVSWKQDVYPLITKLQEEGHPIHATREKVETVKGNNTCKYRLFINGVEYFRTTNIAVVWTYLVGITDGYKRPVNTKTTKEVVAVPSSCFLNDLISKTVLGTATTAERNLMQRYSMHIEEAYDEGFLQRYSGPMQWSSWVDNVQKVMLRNEDVSAWSKWIEKD